MASLLIPDLLFLSFLLLTALHPDIWINCRRSSPTTPLPSPNKQAKIRAGLAQSLVFRTRILWSHWLKVIIQAIQISFLFVLAPGTYHSTFSWITKFLVRNLISLMGRGLGVEEWGVAAVAQVAFLLLLSKFFDF